MRYVACAILSLILGALTVLGSVAACYLCAGSVRGDISVRPEDWAIEPIPAGLGWQPNAHRAEVCAGQGRGIVLFAANQITFRQHRLRDRDIGRATLPDWAQAEVTPWRLGKQWQNRSLKAVVGYGWPFPVAFSVYGSWITTASGTFSAEPGAMELGSRINLPMLGAQPRTIPTHVIWKNAAWGTTLGSAVWFGLLCGLPSGWTIVLRRRRGLCIRCGYPRAGLPPATPCPECGKAPGNG